LIREDNGRELLVDAETRKGIVDFTGLRPGSLQTVISSSDVRRSVTVSRLGLAFRIVQKLRVHKPRAAVADSER
jgi:hypothetical protein